MSSLPEKTKFLKIKGCSDYEPTELFKQKFASFGNSPSGIFKKMCFVIQALIEINSDENGCMVDEQTIQSHYQNLLTDLEMDLERDLISVILAPEY